MFPTAIQRTVGHRLRSQAVRFRFVEITQPDPRGQWESHTDGVRGNAVVPSSRDPAGIHKVSAVMSFCQYLNQVLMAPPFHNCSFNADEEIRMSFAAIEK